MRLKITTASADAEHSLRVRLADRDFDWKTLGNADLAQNDTSVHPHQPRHPQHAVANRIHFTLEVLPLLPIRRMLCT